MDSSSDLAAYLKANPHVLGRVVDFDLKKDRLYRFDFTANNTELDTLKLSDTPEFSKWVTGKLGAHQCKYGIGGYMEHRTIYARSNLFDSEGEPRRLHLGTDIWAETGLPVYAPLEGKIHSFNDNDNFGDYGPTIILEHDLDGLKLYSLFGHLSRESLAWLRTGMGIARNQKLANLGAMDENGQWPSHLHFQLMFDMEGSKGDYPGVCRFSEKEKYQKNIPDPQLILQFPDAVND